MRGSSRGAPGNGRKGENMEAIGGAQYAYAFTVLAVAYLGFVLAARDLAKCRVIE